MFKACGFTDVGAFSFCPTHLLLYRILTGTGLLQVGEAESWEKCAGFQLPQKDPKPETRNPKPYKGTII